MKNFCASLMLKALLALLSIGSLSVNAEMMTVAVASNFSLPAKKLKEKFEKVTEHQIRLVFGSSGKLFAQISQGAPFDLYMSADESYAKRVEEGDQGVLGSRFLYATGKLSIWTRTPIQELAEFNEFAVNKRISMANPRLAPYGAAAQAVLDAMGIAVDRDLKVIMGENVAQAFHFARSGAVDGAFIAYSQWLASSDQLGGHILLVPPSLYEPIEQHAVLLQRAQQNPAAKAFVEFIRLPEQQNLIQSLGYVEFSSGDAL